MTGQFEAKKHGWRQTQDGIVVSFVIHPDDINAALAVAPLGTRYGIAFVQMGDDEKPVVTQPVALEAPASDREDEKARTPWESLPYVTQAAMRCNEPEFQKWIMAADAEAARRYVQGYCSVTSRRDIVRGTRAGDTWAVLESKYQAALAEARYVDTPR